MINLSKINKLLLVVWLAFINSATILAADLKFTPQAPLVEIGKSMVLSVSGTEGEVIWQLPLKGQIQGTGQQVTYFAPAEAGVDEIKVSDSAGNTGTVRILIPPAGTNPLSLENAVWKIFTNRRMITALTLSEDDKTLWVATNGGLEKRETQTGKVQMVLTHVDGLPDNITAILDDGQDGVWVGTRCHTYDYSYNTQRDFDEAAFVSCKLGGMCFGLGPCMGGGFTHYDAKGKWSEMLNPGNSVLPDNSITVLHPDGQGGIWIGTWGGLAHYDVQEQLVAYDLKNLGLSSSKVEALSSDNRGGLWVAIRDNQYYSNDFLAYLNAQNEWQVFSNIQASSFVSDEEGGLWVAKSDGGGIAHYYSSAETVLYPYPSYITTVKDVSVIQSDNQGGLWIIGKKNSYELPELYHLNMQGLSQFSKINSHLLSDWVNATQIDNQGGVWIGARYGLAYCRANAQEPCRVFNESDQVPDVENDVNVLQSDGKGGMWIGTWWGGLAHRNAEGEWTNYPELPDNEVSAILDDSQIGLWVGTYNKGLFHYTEEKTWQVFNTENTNNILEDNHIYTLLSDGQGGLLVGGWGLAHYNVQTNKWTMLTPDLDSLGLGSIVYALQHDSQGNLWVGTSCSPTAEKKCVGLGVARYTIKDNKWYTFDQNDPSLPSNTITALLSDKQGGMWVGTNDSILLHYKDDQWQEINLWYIYSPDLVPLLSLLPNEIYALSDDGSGGLWVGTYRSGLFHHNPQEETWQIFNTANSGLPSNKIYSLLNDNQGELWVGTDEGLARFFLPLSLTQKLIQPSVTTDLDTAQHLVTDKRAAILITGGSSSSKNGLWPTAESISTYFYSVLYKRGFQKNDIYFLAPQSWMDFNGDGRDDKIVSAPQPARPLTTSDIETAFTWAKTHGDPNTGKLDQPLFLFFIGHGHSSGEKILLEESDIDQELFSTQLKEMLDKYQAETGNAVVVLIEACYSGKFRDTLANTSFSRTVISSTDDTQANFDPYDHRSFSRFFASSLLTGRNFSQSFVEAATQQQALVITLKDLLPDLSDQIPKWPESQTTQELFINGPFKAGEALQITSPLKANCLTESDSGKKSSICLYKNNFPFPLQAHIEQHDRPVERVWAVLKPPKVKPTLDTYGNAFLPYPRLAMSPSTQDKNMWEGNWNNAIYEGDYELTFYAEDDERNLTGSSPITLTVKNEGKPTDQFKVPPEQSQVKITLYQQNDKGNWKEIFDENPRYNRGQLFQAKVQEDLNWGYDLYVVIVFPNQKDYLALKNANVPFGLNTPKKWGSLRKQGEPVTVLDLPIPENLETGQYCLYGILSPEGSDVFEAKEKKLWVHDQQCFEVF